MKAYFLDDEDLAFLTQVADELESVRVRRGYEVPESVHVRLRELLRQVRKNGVGSPSGVKGVVSPPLPFLREMPMGVPVRKDNPLDIQGHNP